MKKLTAATAIILILSLVLTSLTAFAAPAEVTDYATIVTALNAASSGDVFEFVCSGDLVSSWDPIYIPQGVTLKLSAADGGASLTTLDVCGEGTFEFNSANFELGQELFIYGSVNATVNGDLSSLVAVGNSKVTVNGNIKAKDKSMEISSVDDNHYSGHDLLVAGENANVKINGSVIAGNVTVTVKNYDAEGSYISVYGDNAVSASEEAKVEITGDAIGGNIVLKADSFNGADTLILFAEGGYGLYSAAAGGSVSVNGKVVGGNASSVGIAYGGEAISSSTSSAVKVGGDVIGGKSVGESGEGGSGIALFPAITEVAPTSESESPDNLTGNIYVSGTVKGGDCENGKDGSPVSAESLYFGKLDSSAAEMDDEEFLDFYNSLFSSLIFVGMTSKLDVSFTKYSDGLAALTNDIQNIMVEYLGEEINYSSDELEKAIEKASSAVKKEMIGKIIDKVNGFTSEYLPESVAAGSVGCDITVWALAKDGRMFAPSYMSGALKNIVSYINRIAACDNGRLSVSVPAAKAGETVEVTPIAEDGYKVSKVFLCGNEITPENGKYTFTVEDGGAILLSAEFVAETSGGTTPGGSTVTPENPKTADGMTSVWFALLAVSAAAILLVRKKAND